MLPEFAIFFEGKLGSTQIVFRGYEADNRAHEVVSTLDTYVTDDSKLKIPRFEPEFIVEIDPAHEKEHAKCEQNECEFGSISNFRFRGEGH